MLQAIFGNTSWRACRMWQRNVEVFRATWMWNCLPPLLEPVLYVLGFGLGLGSLVGVVSYQGESVSYLRFMVPGVISVAVMFWAFFENTYASFVRMYYQGTFDAVMATPLLVEDVILGEWLWGGTKSVIAATLMLVMMGVFGMIAWPSGLLVILIAVGGGLLFAAIGLIVTAISPSIDSFNLPIFLLIMPMFIFSGTFFPIDILPTWAAWIAMTLPLTHVSLLMRGACLGMLPPYWVWSTLYVLLGTAVAVGLAIVLMRRRLVK